MSPEIIKRKLYSGPPVDIWAYGIMLYRAIFGDYPFKGINSKLRNFYFNI